MVSKLMAKKKRSVREIIAGDLFSGEEDTANEHDETVYGSGSRFNPLHNETNINRNRDEKKATEEEFRADKGDFNGSEVFLKQIQSLFISQTTENPGSVIVNVQLTGNNYMAWRKAMLRALCVKEKSEFVLQEMKVPNKDTPEYQKWIKSDSLVISWILNSLAKEVADGFQYASSARELWLDIEHRFGISNGPLLYQIQKEISLQSQDCRDS